MPVTLGGRGCIEPRSLYRECVDHGLSTAWASLPNTCTCPLGVRPGDGWVLMKLGDLKWLSPLLTFADVVGLRFESLVDGAGSRSVNMPSMLIVGADCLTPGFRGDEAAYLVRLADKRHLLARSFVDTAYNLRHSFTSAYVPTTLKNPGSSDPVYAWTWTEMTADVWGTAPLLGTYPGLPFAPTEYPEDIECYQMPTADALDMILDRLGCALKYDPVRDRFGIVRLGAADQAADDALALWDARRHWDVYPLRGALAGIPGGVVVTFRKVPHVRGDGSPFYEVEALGTLVGASSIAGYAENSYRAVVEDDLEALYDAYGALSNAPALAIRAAERATDFYRRLDSATDRRRLVYPFALDDAGLMPGSKIDSITWREAASGTTPVGGTVTEVVRAGQIPRQSWPDVTIDPLTELIRPNGDPVNGLTDAYIDRWDPVTKTWVQRQRIWAVDASS